MNNPKSVTENPGFQQPKGNYSETRHVISIEWVKCEHAMQKIVPFLWFDNQAEEAAKFYVSIFKNSKIGRIARYGEAGAEVSGRPKGTVMTVKFQLEGQRIRSTKRWPNIHILASHIVRRELQDSERSR